jgi:hypothetical protein
MADVQNATCVYIQAGDHYDCLHCAGGRGVPLGACCASCQEKLLDGIVTLGNAIDHHDEWCGHFAEAPGHSSINEAAEFRRWADEWVERHLTDFASRAE